MSHGCGAPYEYRQRKSFARAQAVDELADEKQSGAVGELEGEHDVAVADFGPAELQLQRGFEQADDLAVHVVDRGREKQHGADEPAAVADCGGIFGDRDGVEVHLFLRDAMNHLINRQGARPWRQAIRELL